MRPPWVITPAFVLGGLLHPHRAPIVLVEADQSQAGKGYLVRLSSAVYGDVPGTVTSSKRSPGALEDAFDTQIVQGRAFVALDNLRGRVDSPKLESFCTEPRYVARVYYVGPVTVDPCRTNVFITSNRAELTTDLGNRVSTIRLVKQPPDHRFSTYAEGSILEHVQANQGLFLGAVFSIVRAWHELGKPVSETIDHDFRHWAGVMDWIVTNVLGEAPLMDGHRAVQRRTVNQGLNWLRSVVLAVINQGRLAEWLRPAAFLDILQQADDVEVPGVREGDDIENEDTRNRIFRALGRRIAGCFGDTDEIEVDGYLVKRRDTTDENYRRRMEYCVRRAHPEDVPQVSPHHARQWEAATP